jgi:hypothetical protein
MIVDDLPTGSVLIFAFNLFTSFFFQFFGFVITYFLSTTHAARYGSRAGLGLTFIQYGAYWRAAQNLEAGPSKAEQQELAWWNETMMGIGSGTDPAAPSNTTTLMGFVGIQNATDPDGVYAGDLGWGGKDWLALFFMTFGWVLLFTSIVGFWRVKRWEISIRAASQPQGPATPSDLAREVQVRRNIEALFGFADDRELEASADPQVEAEVRLARHLRAAGLI